ncbi:M23 family metallopeptidase [Patescibacteria group bacterium]
MTVRQADWLWPLRDATPLFPDAPGRFAAVRRHDIHTGVDLYCEVGQEVVAVEDGTVFYVENFTGPNADDPSPWWNDTQAVMVRGASGTVVYGEVESLVEAGDTVRRGQVIAVVRRSVLKRFKGRPTVMLHFELMTGDAPETLWWKLGEPQSPYLLNPESKLVDTAGGRLRHFDLAEYDGESFRDRAGE